jgi:hypothetical protein|tara:strand:- start:3661 stop:4071 length:411 start_codon:yes stop_codon:yes gene_type:complete
MIEKIIIMARWNYFDKGDYYSEWHRIYEGIAYIDIDSVECCKKCYEPLAILETAMDKDHDNKAYTLIKKVADEMKLPAFVVLYKHDGEKISQFRVRRVSPKVSPTYRIASPEEWLEYLRSLQNECKSCKGFQEVEW